MNLYDLYNSFNHDKICLSYLGDFDDDITHKIIDLSNVNLQNSADLSKLKARVSFLIAECFQNVVRHKLEVKNSTGVPDKFFQVNIYADMVCLSSANTVDMKTKHHISNKINQLNALTEEELKELHQTLLKSSDFTEKGGAGLGLIEMARKSRHPLRYYFVDINEHESQFFLSLEVINKKDNSPSTTTHINNVVYNYKILSLEGVLLFYKGDFNEDNVNYITEILRTNLIHQENVTLGKKAMIVVIELIQNISKHALSIEGNKNGVFMLSHSSEGYTLLAGNFIGQDNAKKLKQSFEIIKQLSFHELSEVYKSILFEDDLTEEGNASLGLLEVAKASSGKFKYEIREITDTMSFFEISVNL